MARTFIRMGEEHYPVYGIDDNPEEGEDSWAAIPIEVDDEVLARWRTILDTYTRWQEELRQARQQAEADYQKRHSVNWREHLSKEFGIPLEQA
jgi:hypothetical protein